MTARIAVRAPSARGHAVVPVAGGLRSLTADEIVAMRALRTQGLSGPMLARRYGISVRTVWRWLGAGAIHVVEVDGWQARFCASKGSRDAEGLLPGPVQLEPWRRVG